MDAIFRDNTDEIYRCIIYVGYSSLCDRACYSYSGSTIYCGGKSNLIIPDSNWRTWNYCMRCCIYDPCRTKDFPEKTSYDPGKLWVGYAEWNGTIYYSDHKGTFFVEGIGALAYSFYFVPKYGVLKGIAYAIFHAVSAFCNAGIDILGSSSYMHMVTSPIINFTTIFLVVSGGLGFVVWYDILNNIKQVRSIKDVKRNFFHRLSLQSKGLYLQ